MKFGDVHGHTECLALAARINALQRSNIFVIATAATSTWLPATSRLLVGSIASHPPFQNSTHAWLSPMLVTPMSLLGSLWTLIVSKWSLFLTFALQEL